MAGRQNRNDKNLEPQDFDRESSRRDKFYNAYLRLLVNVITEDDVWWC